MTESFYDKNNKLYVDCAECQRGGNGKKTCSAGWTYKKPGVSGCFAGECHVRGEIVKFADCSSCKRYFATEDRCKLGASRCARPKGSLYPSRYVAMLSEYTLNTPRSLDECTNTPCWECEYAPKHLDPLRMDMGCEQRAGFLQAKGAK